MNAKSKSVCSRTNGERAHFKRPSVFATASSSSRCARVVLKVMNVTMSTRRVRVGAGTDVIASEGWERLVLSTSDIMDDLRGDPTTRGLESYMEERGKGGDFVWSREGRGTEGDWDDDCEGVLVFE